MRTSWLRGAAVLAALALYGCGSQPPPPEASDETRLAENVDFNVADWLGKPRSELAEKGDDKAEYLRLNVDADRGSRDAVELLPDLRPALTPPVFRGAKFSKKLGVSLPPYL